MYGLRLVYEEPSDDEDINYCCMDGLRLVYEEPSDDEDINYCCMDGLRLVYEEPSDDEDINYCCMDRIWAYLGSMRDSLTGHLRFERLARVAKPALTLLHSIADEERVFS
jgi:hypothetical protein